MNPKAIPIRFAQHAPGLFTFGIRSHYPPLRGIVQLTNPDTFHYRDWSFTINNINIISKKMPVSSS